MNDKDVNHTINFDAGDTELKHGGECVALLSITLAGRAIVCYNVTHEEEADQHTVVRRCQAFDRTHV